MKTLPKIAGICTLLFLASFWRAEGMAHAQDPTPTPFPTLEYTGVPTHTMTYTQADGDEVYNLIPVEPPGGVTLTLDVGFWTWDSFVLLFRTGNTVRSLGNQYHVFDILFAFALGGLVIGPIVQIIRSRGGGGAGGGGGEGEAA